MGILDRFRRRGAPKDMLPYDMFDQSFGDAEARRARRMESIYHVGQARIWDGREVLAELLAKHGKPQMAPEQRRALAKIFSIIMWGELAAWKISAQLADQLVPLPAKLAAASQVHDEARHFYVMHDYLEALGETPPPLAYWSKRVVELTLATPSMAKKLAGMQLTIETIALTLFQRVRELEVEPVLCELLSYYERDEARHVGLGVQCLPALLQEMGPLGHVDMAAFQLQLLFASVMGLKDMEQELLSIGVDPRSILAVGFRKHEEIHKAIRTEFPQWPQDPPVDRLFDGLCELMFSGTPEKPLPARERITRAFEVVRRRRVGVIEGWEQRSPS